MNSTEIRRATGANGQRVSAAVTAATASGAATLIVALTIGWLTIGRSAVGRAEVIEMIANSAPYVHDRQALHNSVNGNTQRINELAERLREIERQGHRVEAKLDLLLSEVVRQPPRTTKEE